MEKQKKGMTMIIVILVVCLVGMAGAVVYLLARPAQPERVTESQTPGGKLGYAEGTTVVQDPNALQKTVDEMLEKATEPGMTLEYKNDASSKDGETFQCYIANAVENTYDMYIEIYGDAELTDHLFLSGLVRPGGAFDNIKLEKKLDSGTHRVYVAFTQVEEDLASIHNQILVTMDFSVD